MRMQIKVTWTRAGLYLVAGCDRGQRSGVGSAYRGTYSLPLRLPQPLVRRGRAAAVSVVSTLTRTSLSITMRLAACDPIRCHARQKAHRWGSGRRLSKAARATVWWERGAAGAEVGPIEAARRRAVDVDASAYVRGLIYRNWLISSRCNLWLVNLNGL